MGSRKLAVIVAVAAGAAGLVSLKPAAGQQAHRNGFEARVPVWVRGASDAPFKEIVHDVTDRMAHAGQLSEHVQLMAEQGTYIQYAYPLGKALISDELSISVWVRANRPGIQLQARVVLPNERAPNLEDRLTTVIRGDQYQLAGRWQRLELRRAVKLSRQQQQLMRAELKRDVNFSEAYVDRLFLNVYGGPGMTEVWIDDLEVSPVQEVGPLPAAPSAVQATPTSRRTPPRASVVELNQVRLLVDGKPFFFLGIRPSDAPLETLRAALFNTVWFDYTTPPDRLEQAVNMGFWLVPSLPVGSGDPRLASASSIGQEVSRFLQGDSVLFWELGSGLAAEQSSTVGMAAKAMKLSDVQRPLSGDVWDAFRPYSRSLDLIGYHRWPLMTALELPQYREWLNQRRLLTEPDKFTWTWIQTHLPDWYVNLIYEQSSAAPFHEPIGPQPEQIRLLTYVAIASGCRGLGYWTDRFLGDTHQGRDRLLTLALLNQEIKMLEPMLLSAKEPYWITAESTSDVKAAVFRCEYGTLALPMWLGKGGQYVPDQASASQLKIVVPDAPGGSSAWLVSPAEVRALQMERIPGGWRVTLPEFGMTAAIVFTADTRPDGLLVRFQDQCRRMRKVAAQWSYDLAKVELEKVEKVEKELEEAGHTLPDGTSLLGNARSRIKACEEFWESGDYTQAYAEAERAMRPLRILMRSQWEQAIRGLDAPVASPYAVSFYTLPRHWRFMQQFRQMTPGDNQLADGDFEGKWGQPFGNWTPQEANLDGVQLFVRRIKVPNLPVAPPPFRTPLIEGSGATHLMPLPTDPDWLELIKDATANGRKPRAFSKPKPSLLPPKELGSQCLELEIKAGPALTVDGKVAPAPVALQRTFLAINSPAVKLPPGTLVRISAWIQVPLWISSSVDGALFYDSAGGEPLALRLVNQMGWRKFTIYRRVPASGSIYVTMALTGLGKVCFDNVKIEPMIPGSTAANQETGVRKQESGVRSQESGVRSQELGRN